MKTISLPNGRSMRVPDHVTEEQAYKVAAEDGLYQPEQSIPRKIMSAVNSATMPTQNFISSAIKHATGGIDPLAAIDQGVELATGRNPGMNQPNSTASKLGGVAGMIGGGMLMGSSLRNLGAKAMPRVAEALSSQGGVLQRLGGSALEGAGVGGIYGAAEAPQGGRLSGAGTGAGFGAIGAPVAQGVGYGLRMVPQATKYMRQLFSPDAEFLFNRTAEKAGHTAGDLIAAGQKTPIELSESYIGSAKRVLQHQPRVGAIGKANMADRSAAMRTAADDALYAKFGAPNAADAGHNSAQQALEKKASQYYDQLDGATIPTPPPKYYGSQPGMRIPLTPVPKPEEDIAQRISRGTRSGNKVLRGALERERAVNSGTPSLLDAVTVHNARTSFSKAQQGAIQSGNAGLQDIARALKHNADAVLETAVPEYKYGVETHRVRMNMRDKYEEGLNFMTTKPSVIKKIGIDNMTPTDRQGYIAGALIAIDDAASNVKPHEIAPMLLKKGFRKKLIQLMGPEGKVAFDKLLQAAETRRIEKSFGKSVRESLKRGGREPVNANKFIGFKQQLQDMLGAVMAPKPEEAARYINAVTGPSSSAGLMINEYTPPGSRNVLYAPQGSMVSGAAGGLLGGLAGDKSAAPPPYQ